MREYEPDFEPNEDALFDFDEPSFEWLPLPTMPETVSEWKSWEKDEADAQFWAVIRCSGIHMNEAPFTEAISEYLENN